MLDEIERWINDRYGTIWHESVITPLVEIHSVAVPLFASVAIGMGPTRQLAIHDLYEELSQRRDLPTALTGFWRERRDNFFEARMTAERVPVGRQL